MKKNLSIIIYIVFIICIIFIVFFLQFLFQKKLCFNRNGIWHKYPERCITEKLDILVQKMILSKTIYIGTIEYDIYDRIYVPLNEIFIMKGEQYRTGETKQPLYTYEDGVRVIFEMHPIRAGLYINEVTVISNKNRNAEKYNMFLAPFFLDYGGSGTFFYLGLFLLDLKDNNVLHKASLYLGDRIKNIKLYMKGNDMWIRFKEHSITQSCSEFPKKQVNKQVFFDKESIKFEKNE